MKSKLLLGIGLAAGYVLGSRSGRAAYEKIKARATGLWESEPVQQKVSAATETIKEKAPEVAEQLGEAARRAGTVIGQSVHRDSDEKSTTAAGAAGAGAAVPGHSTHPGTSNLNTHISPDSGDSPAAGYETAEGLPEATEEHDRTADVAGSHARTSDVDSDPALNDSTGQDWTDEGGATPSGAATNTGPREP
ncbi:YtxH domain-containing protein [Pseudarthrobacter sp. J64]|uniref:YtxH domain-containing protein n=1 Tax=Pseudarthrobacter sp. J64 TaxID=3116485 RepID=UPI002E814E83|nr:YtxH domain-containing protein [Pseudarthrobacter sp. J64]MEE2569978.1 YtxH domain-containing protein [Pseudarthrobacter sp. J64]